MISESDIDLSRRDFLRTVSMAAIASAAANSAQARVLSTPELSEGSFGHEASHYKALDGGIVQCTLCPWHCVVPDGTRGKCGVRENRQGRYYTLVYGRPCAINNDPIGGREDTRCPQCKAYVLKRYGHMVISDELAKGKCPNCGAPIPGVWA